jgi:hypothetical protein
MRRTKREPVVHGLGQTARPWELPAQPEGADAQRRRSTAPWRERVRTEVQTLEAELLVVKARRSTGPPRTLVPAAPSGIPSAQVTDEGTQGAAAAGIREHLAEAWDATLVKGPFRRLKEWWTGAAIERAWTHLHAAKASVADFQDPVTLSSRAPGLIERAKQSLPRDGERLVAIQERLKREGWDQASEDTQRANFRSGLDWTYEASDNYFQQVRSFRNLVIAATFALFVLCAGLALLGAAQPTALPMCFPPQPAPSGAGAPTDQATSACPTGGSEPSGPDVALVELLGLVGGALAGTVAIRGMRGTATPYGVPVSMALLKLPFGALTAFLAILLFRAEFVPGLSALDSQNQILAYAVVFGYAQQLLTKLIDRQGQKVLDKVPTTEPPNPSQPESKEDS